jgi:hypothetical protein
MFNIDLTRKEFETKKNVQNLEGGYFWTYDNGWYNWKPDTIKVGLELARILKFCGV